MDDDARLTVLLLEDMALIRAMLREGIAESVPGATIHEAASYDDAIRTAESLAVDVAFLDIDLKRTRTGIDVLRTLKEKGRVRHAVMLSETFDDAVVMECLGLGAAGYIHKNSDDPTVFRRAVDVVQAGGTFLPQRLTGSRQAPASLDEIGVTGRPREALFFLLEGCSNKQIANHMGVTEATVANQYMTKLFRIFGVTSRLKLVAEVRRRGLVIPDPRAAADDPGTGGSSRR